MQGVKAVHVFRVMMYSPITIFVKCQIEETKYFREDEKSVALWFQSRTLKLNHMFDVHRGNGMLQDVLQERTVILEGQLEEERKVSSKRRIQVKDILEWIDLNDKKYWNTL